MFGEHEYEVLTSSREGIQRQSDHFGSTQRHDTDGYNVIPRGYCTYRNRSDDGRFTFNINNISDNGIVSKFYPVFRFKNADSIFVTEYLNSSPRVKKKLSVLAVGTSQVVLSFETLKRSSFPLPTEPEQRKIAAFLDLLNQRIERQRAYVDSLKKYKRGLLSSVFNHGAEKCCKKVHLNEVANFLPGLTYSPSDVSSSGILVLRSSNIQEGRLSYGDCVYVDKQISSSLKPHIGDVLMCVRNGSKNLVGKTALIEHEMKNVTWGAFMMIIRSNLHNNYLYHYLNSPHFFSQVFKDSGTATINQITKGLLNECTLPLPSSEEQVQNATILDKIETRINIASDELTNLHTLKKSLMQQLFI